MKDQCVLNYVVSERTLGENRFNKKIEEVVNSPEKWLYLTRNSSKLKAIPKEFKGDSAVEKYFEMSRIMAFSEEENEKYNQDMRDSWDILNAYDFYENKGREEGKAEGKAEGKIEGIAEAKREMAAKLLEKGADFNLISECTGLSAEEILAITQAK